MDNPNSEKVNEVKKVSSKQGAGVLALTKEKLVIVVAMAAFAMVLVAVAILLTFGRDEPLGIVKNNHTHDYDMGIEVVDGKVNLVGHCKGENCTDPDYIKKDVKGAAFTDTVVPTCISEGKRVYTLNYDGEELKYEVTLPKGGHVNYDTTQNEDGSYNYKKGVTIPMLNGMFVCGSKSNLFYLICADCGKRDDDSAGDIMVNVNHSYSIDHAEIIKKPSLTEGGKVVLSCIHDWCDHKETVDLDRIITDGENKNAVLHDDGYMYTTTVKGVVISLFIE